MMAPGRRSNTSSTARSMSETGTWLVPKVSTMTDTGLETPMA